MNLYHKLALILGMVLVLSPALAARDINIDGDVYELMIEENYVSQADIKTYKHIFKAIKNNDISEANELIADLQSDILLGHVQAEKYLSAKYKASFEELKTWLEQYGDYPQAYRIYNLATKKGEKQNLPDPDLIRMSSYNRQLYARNKEVYDHLSAADKTFAITNVTKFYGFISKGKTLKARNILENKRFRQIIPNKYWDEMSASLSMVYFLDNNDMQAIEWAKKPALRSKNATAYWVAGLASWRLKQYSQAAEYFSSLGAIRNNDEWLESAGAYWAYRSYMRIDKHKQAMAELKQAARYQRTFYGILAAHTLGQKFNYNWNSEAYWNDFSNADYAKNLVKSSSLRRAVALLHAKRTDLAEAELRSGYENMNEKEKEAVIFLLNSYNRHSLAIKLSNQLKDYDKGIYYDCMAYPVPAWLSEDWKSDKALTLALMHQESAFDPAAKSSAGACGLMQLMPNTAYHVTGDKKLKKDNSKLFNADYNLLVGQQYVDYLMAKTFIDGNLFFMLTAYNAGPGNLVKWQKKVKYNNDPLLFIEVIPSRETRIYIERVMANYWVYSMLYNQEAESLEQLKSGLWPIKH